MSCHFQKCPAEIYSTICIFTGQSYWILYYSRSKIKPPLQVQYGLNLSELIIFESVMATIIVV